MNTLKKYTGKKINPEISEVTALFDLFKKTPIYLKTNQLLFKENTLSKGIYYINKGSVKIVKNNLKGKEIILKYSYSGNILGLNSLIKGKKHCFSVLANEPSEVLFITKKDFVELLSSGHSGAKYILINLCKQLEDAESIIEKCYLEYETKIAEAIIILYNHFQNNVKQNKKFIISEIELSCITGVAIEQLKQIITKFNEIKLVSMKGNSIISADIAELKKLYNIKK